jgi:bifunctional N-acetylglucosamine-1-phosphate-uridyltransferase/glucosamine-1-phosphate-acetyltransferase GlmU-like protein
MDTVILAAGKGSRLNGIAAPYHKPLLVVNGRPLIRHAVEVAHRVTGRTPIVIVAPENALPISQVLENEPAKLMVQRTAHGPGHALLLGLEMVKEQTVLVLMADNVLTFADVQRVASQAKPAVGVQLVSPHDAERFTRLRRNAYGTLSWIEKVPIEEADIDESTGEVLCWVGPLLLHVETTHDALHRIVTGVREPSVEIPIGPPVLNAHEHIAQVAVSTYDIGAAEVWKPQ